MYGHGWDSIRCPAADSQSKTCSFQAETQEAIIQDASNLCDIAESLCRAREEEFKQSLMDLPVWASPQDLMAALSDD